MVGTLHKGNLMVSETHRFENVPVQANDSLEWNIGQIYQELVDGFRGIGKQEEPVHGISCTSWGADYLLFESNGSLLTPAFHHRDPRTESVFKKVLSKVPWENVYAETGWQKLPGNTLFQIAAESRRVKRASRLLSVADGFNYLFSGAARTEESQASATQLFNPVTKAWSEPLLKAIQLSPKLLAEVVPAGTKLGELRADLAAETGLSDAQVIASCSHEIASALIGLPIEEGEGWGFLWPGQWTRIGSVLEAPFINDVSRELGFSNQLGYGGSVPLYKETMGFWIFEECKRFWSEADRALDSEVLMHLAVSAPPFEALIDPSDARFSTPGDMPLKIQAFCKETNQMVPRKPGPITRCILESLALSYRKSLTEIEYVTGTKVGRLFVLGATSNTLSNNFISNALQVPVVVASANATAVGNILVQALALGHIPSLTEGREIVRRCCKMETIFPYASAWNEAYDRFVELIPA
jgi:rhamnulokinase